MAKKCYVIINSYGDITGPFSTRRDALYEAGQCMEVVLSDIIPDLDPPATVKTLTKAVSVIDLSAAPTLDLTKIAEKIIQQDAKEREEDARLYAQGEKTRERIDHKTLECLAERFGYILVKE